MRNEQDKYMEEQSVLTEFARKAGLDIKHETMRKGDPNAGEPDIYCKCSGEYMYFELAEACAPEFARAIAEAVKNGSEAIAAFGSDGIEDILTKKLGKTYRVNEPVELVLYTNGRNALPDDILIAKAGYLLHDEIGPFQRIWLHGDDIHQLGAPDN